MFRDRGNAVISSRHDRLQPPGDAGARRWRVAVLGRGQLKGPPQGDEMAPGLATDETLETGTELNGTYVILGKLFEGGMGDIYEARHVRLTGRYAIKVLRRNLTGQHASAFDRFRREAEGTSSLRHPHIVQVLDFNQVPN